MVVFNDLNANGCLKLLPNSCAGEKPGDSEGVEVKGLNRKLSGSPPSVPPPPPPLTLSTLRTISPFGK